MGTNADWDLVEKGNGPKLFPPHIITVFGVLLLVPNLKQNAS